MEWKRRTKINFWLTIFTKKKSQEKQDDDDKLNKRQKLLECERETESDNEEIFCTKCYISWIRLIICVCWRPNCMYMWRVVAVAVAIGKVCSIFIKSNIFYHNFLSACTTVNHSNKMRRFVSHRMSIHFLAFSHTHDLSTLPRVFVLIGQFNVDFLLTFSIWFTWTRTGTQTQAHIIFLMHSSIGGSLSMWFLFCMLSTCVNFQYNKHFFTFEDMCFFVQFSFVFAVHKHLTLSTNRVMSKHTHNFFEKQKIIENCTLWFRWGKNRSVRCVCVQIIRWFYCLFVDTFSHRWCRRTNENERKNFSVKNCARVSDGHKLYGLNSVFLGINKSFDRSRNKIKCQLKLASTERCVWKNWIEISVFRFCSQWVSRESTHRGKQHKLGHSTSTRFNVQILI